MKFTIKKIGGKQYYYATDSLYIAKGQSVLKNKSLGRIDNPLEERWNEVRKFEEDVIQQEAQKRIIYWSGKIKHLKGFQYDLDSLEKLRSTLVRKKQSVGMFGQSGLEAAFKTDFIYNSNKIEGSKVPRETIENTIKKGDGKNQEVTNSLKALSYLRDVKIIVTLKNIVSLHDILLAHEPENIGIRKEAVIVGNSETAPHEEILPRLKELFAWYEESTHRVYPPDLAFTFYYRFERIHPFSDGNGRTGRMIMNSILKEHRYHPIIIWNENRDAHMSAFEKAINGEIHKYLQFMNEQMKLTYKIYLEKINKALMIERNIEETFFKPSR